MSRTRRSIFLSLLLGAGVAGSAIAAPTTAAPQATAASAEAAADTTPTPTADQTAANSPLSLPASVSATPAQRQLMQMDLSVWGMYQHADIVVKIVMIGLLLASVVTWALFFGKGAELLAVKRRVRRELQLLKDVRSLDQATTVAANFSPRSLSARLLAETANELDLSARLSDNNGIKERVAFRLERRVAGVSRAMGKGNGFLATIGAISPFIGLFGTVWGIMNSFIDIAHTQTTNLAVVAPGIAEALLATAIGLFAAIPAVVIYNIFARTIASYKAMVGDCAAQLLLLLGRDLDLAAEAGSQVSAQVTKFRVG
ncbi:tol-pal system-associated acyl-CoA thioesterase [Candidatus Sodalis pierantonius]|uniref:tol-pal system-associated acyl-CoA thioesterase n=1 Tax=Candidatus Sodalis pierantonii TaxID=1486991 RepID=UPI001F01E684|nr:tol-pal system-associated acyl-CoA thioesterase [Candidatus Sodalis pierantonius]